MLKHQLSQLIYECNAKICYALSYREVVMGRVNSLEMKFWYKYVLCNGEKYVCYMGLKSLANLQE